MLGRRALVATFERRSSEAGGTASKTCLGNWVARDRGERESAQGLSTDDVAELKRLRSENVQLRMERDVLKRSVALWVKDATK